MEIVSAFFLPRGVGELGGWVSLSRGAESWLEDKWKGPESAGGFEKFSLIAPKLSSIIPSCVCLPNDVHGLFNGDEPTWNRFSRA